MTPEEKQRRQDEARERKKQRMLLDGHLPAS